MKKLVTVVLLILLSVSFAFAGGAINTVWEKGVAAGTKPLWFDTGNLTRGLDYGKVGGNDRVYVVSRSGGSFIYILNAANGDSVGLLDNRGMAGGTYVVSDVGVSDDGKIYVCNLAVGGTFKVYAYNSEIDSPKVVISYDATGKRLGDKFTVTGSTTDNSIVIWAASATTSQVVKFTTADNGVTFAPTVVDIGIFGGSASVGPLPDASFYWNSGGNSAKKFTAAGVLIGTVPGSVVAIGSNAIRFITATASDEIFVTYQFGGGNENARVVLVPGGDVTQAQTYGLTATLGTNANVNGTGDVAVQNLGGGIFRVYVLSTNNGFGAYDVNTNYMRGTYYVGAAGTGPAGANPDFASLKEAFDKLNVTIIGGNCTFYITSNIDEPCIGAGLGLAVDPTPHSIVFKPFTGVVPVITLAYPADANEGPSGAFVVGIPDLGTAGHRINWPDIRPTRNIIIDGSNTEGGTTRDLTIQNATTAHRNGIPMVIVGDAQNITIKNTNLLYKPVVVSTSGGLFIGAVMIRARYDFIPKNLLFENNLLSANFDGVPQNGQGIGTYCASTTLPTGDFPNAITIKNNLIEGKRRAIGLNYSGSTDILNNEIILNQNIADGLTNEAIFAYNVKAGAIINIRNNKITKVSSKNSTANTTGNAGISIETAGIYNIFNNMITGFELTAANPSAYIYGVKNSSASAIMHLLHNTLVMNDLADIGTGNVKYYGFHIADGQSNVKNNIVVNNEDNFAAYNFYRTGSAGTIISDYNDLYRNGTVNAKTGSWNGADAASLADWQTASGLDANSITKMVDFASASDLHLAGASVGDLDLAGIPLAEVTTDIDGETRSIANPYMGADEGAVELQPPSIITIAEAKVDANSDYKPDLLGQEVEIEAVIASPNYGTASQYYMQDETAGIVLYSATIKVALNFGDKVHVKGKILQYRGLSEIEPASASDVVVLSTGNVVTPSVIKIADLSEPYEAMLVQCDRVWIVNPDAWPPAGSNSSSTNKVLITDGVDTNYIFIDKETDLDGWTPPTGLITLIAQCDQYTTSASVYNDGYSFRGTTRENFISSLRPPYIPIAQARIDGNGDFIPDSLNKVVTIKGVITTPNYTAFTNYYLQDSTAGIVLYASNFMLDLTRGDEVQIKGKIIQYRGITEIQPDSASWVTLLSSGNAVVPKVITMADIGEATEAQLVQFNNVWIVNPQAWPPEGSNSSSTNKVLVTDGKDTTYIFIDKETDLDGWTPPTGMLKLIAASDQYTTSASVYNDGYSLRGTYQSDITELIPPPPEPKPLYTMWAKTQAAGTFPAYISTSSYTRDMAYGKVNGLDRIYVVTRSGDHRTVIYDALTGDSLGVIPKPSQAEGVGLFHLNAVDVSDDGLIFVSNMSLGSDAVHPFRVYSWKSETDVAATAISYDAAIGRMGDMISVYGKASDNSLTIYAGVANGDKFVKFTTADNGDTFTPQVFTLPSGNFGTLPNIAQTKAGMLYIKSYGRSLFLFDPATSKMDTLSGTVVGTGATKIKYFSTKDKEYLLVYYPDVPGAGGAERLSIVDVTGGTKKAFIAYNSASIGKTANGNGTGSVDVMPIDDKKFLCFILGTNNGVAALTNDSQFVIANLDTLFYGNTPVLHKNPFGAGFIVGTNAYGDIGKYQRFDFKMGDELFGFKYYFAYKEIVNDPDTLHLVVKKVTSNGMPGDLLASIVITTDVLDTTMIGNVFFLDAPMPVDTSVFIGFEWSTLADDQFALFADADGEGEKADRAWERFSDGSYNDFLTVLNPSYSWGVDVDLWIAAYYKKGLPSAVDDLANETLPTTYAVKQNYPNPFNPSTFIEIALPEKADVEIVVFNLLGQKVAEVFKGKINAGQHRFLFDAKGLSSGIYFYHVKANHFKAVKKMTLMK